MAPDALHLSQVSGDLLGSVPELAIRRQSLGMKEGSDVESEVHSYQAHSQANPARSDSGLDSSYVSTSSSVGLSTSLPRLPADKTSTPYSMTRAPGSEISNCTFDSGIGSKKLYWLVCFIPTQG